MITATKEEERLLLRTRGVLANDLAWAHLASSSSAPAAEPLQELTEARPPPGEKARKLLANGEDRAARRLRLQVL